MLGRPMHRGYTMGTHERRVNGVVFRAVVPWGFGGKTRSLLILKVQSFDGQLAGLGNDAFLVREVGFQQGHDGHVTDCPERLGRLSHVG